MKEKINETDYIINTPDRRSKTRVCHINMLKKFVRDSTPNLPITPVTPALPVVNRERRRFLGMAGYYEGFCKNFSSVVAALTNLLSSTRVFQWNTDCTHAFQAAKDLLSNAPILAVPEFNLPFKLQADASHFGAGAQGIDHPVS